MKEKDVITMNGDHVHVAEWRPTEEARPQGENGSTASGEQTNRVGHPSLAREHRTNRNRRLMSGDHLTSETDSEEEFCDTSDQPSQVWFYTQLLGSTFIVYLNHTFLYYYIMFKIKKKCKPTFKI